MAATGAVRLILAMAGLAILAGCEEGQGPKFLNKPLFQNNNSGEAASADGAFVAAGTVVERDVEAPEVFSQTDQGLWDGRPSLGGVWVAHPDVRDPERVIIRNTANGKFVIGALFQRERENPGPRFQISSDAAEALGILAGAPAPLDVVAMRREEVDIPAPAPIVTAEALAAETQTAAGAEAPAAAAAAGSIETRPLDGVTAMAAGAIEAATSGRQDARAATAAAAPAVAAPAPAKTSSLDKAFVQIGIFSVEANAGNTGEMLRRAGIIPTIKKSNSSGKDYWRVIVGPAANAAERSTLLAKVKELGFADAYAVSG